MKLSIIFGTFNRLEMLKACVESIRHNLQLSDFPKDKYEFVIADAGSTDGSREWLSAQKDVVLLGEWKLEGAVKAFNKAYALSTGENILVINDDVELRKGSLTVAMERLRKSDLVGQLALGFTRGNSPDVQLFPSHANKWYANLGMIKREVAEKVISVTGGLWSPIYHTYGADTELSCMVHRLGYMVFPYRELVFHDKLCADELRAHNYHPERSEKDGKTFWKRWPDPKMLEPKGLGPNLTPEENFRLAIVESTT